MPLSTPRSGPNESVVALRRTDVSQQLISEIEVRAGEQLQMSLGRFTKAEAPKGFVIQVTPDRQEDAISAQITRITASNGYELMLDIANNDDETATAEVWQLL
jgi:hypothetical protein